MEPKVIYPVYLDGRYGPHMIIPFKNKWDGLGDEELKPEQQEFFVPESYYRAIGNDFNNPEAIDLDGGPYMQIGFKFEDKDTIWVIDKFNCSGKYPIIICSKL